jgi:tetratricopeptide (TPR) repeat protein
MKNISLSIFLGFSTISLIAQAALIQNGLVREQNSGKRSVADVQIIFSQAAPTTSDQAGKFRLTFAGKKAGDLAFMTEITKKGYELVNDKELEHLKLSSTELLGTDIIVAKVGVLEAAKKDYYAISDKALKTSFEKQKALLRGELDKTRLSEKQYQDQFEALQKQYENQKKELDNLSEKFAKVNFDDVSTLYQAALQLFKNGKIDEAIQKLESANLIERTDKRLKERERIANENTINEKGIQEDIKSLKLQADLYVLKFDITKAELVYERMLNLDSTRLDLLVACANFYQEQHRYEKALRLYPKIIVHTQADAWQKAYAFGSTGDMFMNIGQLNKALDAFLQHKTIHEGLLKKNPNFLDSKEELGVSNSRLGNIQLALGNLDKALGFYEDYNNIAKELYAAKPNDGNIKQGLAISYAKLGGTHTELGDLVKALGYFEGSHQLAKELNADYPNDEGFKKSLAVSYQFLGTTHTVLGNLDQVLGFYEASNQLEKELYTDHPNNLDYKNGLAISYQLLGTIQLALGNLDEALGFYENYNRLSKELYDSFPKNVDFKNSLAISFSKLGETHLKLKDFDKALTDFEQFNALAKQLYATQSNNVEVKKALMASYSKLGQAQTELGNLDKALPFCEESCKLAKEFHAAYPDNVEFTNNLSITLSKIGQTQTALGNLELGLNYYEQSAQVAKKLHLDFPKNVEFKNNLAIAYINLAIINRDNLKDKAKAKTYFKEIERLWSELARDAPQHPDFANHLLIVQTELAELDSPLSAFEQDGTGNATKEVAKYAKIIDETSRTADKAPPQYQLVNVYENLLKTYRGNRKDSTNLATEYGSLTWYLLFAKQFPAAELSAKRGISLDASQEWVSANLATALLYQGKWDAAKTLYLSLKDKVFGKVTFKETFLSDLDELEKAGVTHADVAKFRALLKQ